MTSTPDVYCESSVPAYRVEGAGPLLVYVPGLDGTGEMLFKQMPELARSYRVVSFRLRDGGLFTYEDLADDVAAIIKDIGEQRATILTESFGGGVALTFALHYPSMLERLVLVNSFPRYRRRIRIRLAARLASIIPFRLIWPVRKAADRVGLLVDDVTGEDRRRFFEIIRTVERDGYVRRLRLIAELDLDDRLSEIKVPVLLIATEKDLLVRSVAEARLMAERMPCATVKTIKGAGHACLLGNRVRLAEILDEWSMVSSQQKR
ncbi:MAG: alpha/beta hydrolase [Blastocatellia bacterium]|nr:alpha/beta hydrolase [Blastocatellia bacterium]